MNFERKCFDKNKSFFPLLCIFFFCLATRVVKEASPTRKRRIVLFLPCMIIKVEYFHVQLCICTWFMTSSNWCLTFLVESKIFRHSHQNSFKLQNFFKFFHKFLFQKGSVRSFELNRTFITSDDECIRVRRGAVGKVGGRIYYYYNLSPPPNLLFWRRIYRSSWKNVLASHKLTVTASDRSAMADGGDVQNGSDIPRKIQREKMIYMQGTTHSPGEKIFFLDCTLRLEEKSHQRPQTSR